MPINKINIIEVSYNSRISDFHIHISKINYQNVLNKITFCANRRITGKEIYMLKNSKCCCVEQFKKCDYFDTAMMLSKLFTRQVSFTNALYLRCLFCEKKKGK